MGQRSYRGQAQKTALDRFMQRFARTRLGGFLFVTAFPAIDKRTMPLTKGRLRIGARQPILLLHARGAKSGQERVTPLLYTPRGDDFVLVASKAGAPHNPAWYHNLKAHPDVEVRSTACAARPRPRGRRRRARGALGAGERRLQRLRHLPAAAGARRIPVPCCSLDRELPAGRIGPPAPSLRSGKGCWRDGVLGMGTLL